MNCKRCGAKIEKGNFFCDKCGQSVGTVSEVQEYMREENRRKKTAVLGVVLAVLVICGVGYTAYNRMSGGNETVSESMLNMQTPEVTEQAAEVVLEGTPEPELTEEAVAEPVSSDEVIDAPAEQEPVQAEEAAAEQVSEESGKSNEYLYPSDTTLFTREYLQSLDRQGAKLARNELYARYGMIFGVSYVKEHFESMSWYKPNENLREGQIYDMFNDIERKNNRLIVEYEKEMGW